MPDPAALPYRRIAIAGGSRGIGAALALALAAPGRRLFLAARDPAPLATSASACRAWGAEVETCATDLSARGGAARWIADLEAAPDLLICAAGLFGGRPVPGVAEPEAVARAVIAANLSGCMALAEAGAARMRGQAGARIVLLGSLAARDPLPDARAYSASKAGLACYARALRADLAEGPGVLLVEPGHVATRQTAQHRGALPLLLTPEAAAVRILRALGQGRSHLAFPRRAVWALALLNRLPPAARRRVMRNQRFTVDNAPVLEAPAAAEGRGRTWRG